MSGDILTILLSIYSLVGLGCATYLMALKYDPDPGLTKRNGMACYHARQRKDCQYYQRGACSCTYTATTTIDGMKVDPEVVNK